MRAAALFLLLLLLVPARAAPQEQNPPSFRPHPGLDFGPAWLATPAGALGASLVLPGAGQAALGLRRWWVYGALEAGLWIAHLEARSDERRFRSRYRDLAWDVARSQTGERRDAGWGYYEAMSQYLASGAYDSDAASPGLQPETDPATYNGAIWDLAEGLYLPGGTGTPGTPGYERALAYYAGRAAGPDFLWDWSGSEAELDRFRALIERTDDEARLARGALGLVLANHLVAAIDAFIVARLRTQGDLHLESGISPAGPGLRWHVSLELSTSY